MFLKRDLQVELRDGREIVISKGERRPKTPSKEAGRRLSSRPDNSSSSKKDGEKRGGRPQSSSEHVEDMAAEEYIRTKEYDEEEDGPAKPTALKQSARERSSSLKGRRHTVAVSERTGVYKHHPRRSAFKK